MSAPTTGTTPGARSLTAAAGDGSVAEAMAQVSAVLDTYQMPLHGRMQLRRAARWLLSEGLDQYSGSTIQDRWEQFEDAVFAEPQQVSPSGPWLAGTRALVITRAVRPGWAMLQSARIAQWLSRLPPQDPLRAAQLLLEDETRTVAWATPNARRGAVVLGVRLLLATGCDTLQQLTAAEVAAMPYSKGGDVLDTVLCRLGVLDRTPQRGSSRAGRKERRSPTELATAADVPAAFQSVTAQYLETYAARLDPAYNTLRGHLIGVRHFWRWLASTHPEITASNQVDPSHGRAYLPAALELAGSVRRRRGTEPTPPTPPEPACAGRTRRRLHKRPRVAGRGTDLFRQPDPMGRGTWIPPRRDGPGSEPDRPR